MVVKRTNQNKTHTITLPKIGEVNMHYNSRAKNFSIKLAPHKGIRVTVPRGMSFEAAEKSVIERTEWIKQAIQKIQKIENQAIIFDENSNFKTKFHQLKIQKSKLGKITGQIGNGLIEVNYPENLSVKDVQLQNFIKKLIIIALTKEAKVILPQRLKEVAIKYNFRYNRVSIRNAKTRWGSCSSENNISLSLHLMRLPEHLIDYVLLHELCHTIEKNHGPRFWALLQKVTGNAKMLAKEMKNYRTSF